MKKKWIMAAVCAAAVAAVVLGGCGDDDYAFLNDMLKADYSEVVLTVTDTFDAQTSLTSVYTISYEDARVTVSYRVEEFAPLGLTGGSADFKRVRTGKAAIEGGEVTVLEGEDVGLDAAVAERGFTFREGYFQNAELTGSYLSADVKDPGAFLGTATDCTDMHLWATFFECFYTIEISYTSASGSAVEIAYEFTL